MNSLVRKPASTTSVTLDAEQTSAVAASDHHIPKQPSEGSGAPCAPSNEPLVEGCERKSSLFDAAGEPSSKASSIKPNLPSGLAKSFIQQLPIPTPERLLPIGQYATESVSTIVERVREGLAIPEATSSNETTDDRSDSAASCCHARDALSSSPRKLTKQSALESPPQALVNENEFGQPRRSTTIGSAFVSHAEQQSVPATAGDSKKGESAGTEAYEANENVQ
uniref:Uncharacterized protein n=1 Tax=Anopheles stephensi TaxID=30069 RepID=A0A182YN02_ANOST